MDRKVIAWWLWFIGTILIVLSWFGVVSYRIGWLGFGIGMCGSVLGWGIRPPKSISHGSNQPDEKNTKSPGSE